LLTGTWYGAQVVPQDSNRIALRLLPSDALAWVTHVEQQVAQLGHRGRRSRRGAPARRPGVEGLQREGRAAAIAGRMTDVGQVNARTHREEWTVAQLNGQLVLAGSSVTEKGS
jgi:hypothetical protein